MLSALFPGGRLPNLTDETPSLATLSEMKDSARNQVLQNTITLLRANDPGLTRVWFSDSLLTELLTFTVDFTGLAVLTDQLSEQDMQLFAEALKRNTNLTELWFSKDQLRDLGVQVIADALKLNTGLTKLELVDNQLGDHGAIAIADALKLNTSLIELNLEKNQIGDRGTHALAWSLVHNTHAKLAKLNLTKNRLGDSGTETLAELLKLKDNPLTKLDLSSNNIGECGVLALAEALKLNHSLTDLILDGNWVGENGARALAEALEQNTSLLSLGDLDLDNFWGRSGFGERIGQHIKAAITTALDRNRVIVNRRAKSLFRQGQQFASTRDFQQATAAFSQAMSLYQTSSRFGNSSGAIGASALSEFSDQFAHTRQKLRQANDLVQRGQAHLQAQRNRQALSAFDQALAVCRDHTAAQQGRQTAQAALPPPQPAAIPKPAVVSQPVTALPYRPTTAPARQAEVPQPLAREQLRISQMAVASKRQKKKAARLAKQQAASAKDEEIAALRQQLAQANRKK